MTKRKLAALAVGLAVAFAATSTAFAALPGSKHDFTPTGGTPITGVQDMCLTCHVPHKPKVNVPLWGHTLTTSTFQLYSTNAKYSGNNTAAYDASPSDLVGSRSRLCLSCHDGTVAVAGTTFLNTTDPSWMLYDDGLPVSGGAASVGLKGSHPVAVNYNTVRTNQPIDYKDISADQDVKLEDSKVQCTSCHNPHNKIPGTKMLAKDNSVGAALCLTCHNK